MLHPRVTMLEPSHRRAVTARPASATLCDAPRAAGHHGPITRLVLAGNPSFCDLARDGRWRDFDGDADDCPPLRNDLSESAAPGETAASRAGMDSRD